MLAATSLVLLLVNVGGLKSFLSAFPQDVTVTNKFHEYVNRFGKEYANDEWKTHYQIFKARSEFVALENMQGHEYSLGLNRFADIPWNDLEKHYFGIPGIPTVMHDGDLSTFKHMDGAELVSSIDWREKGAVTAVKDQGTCGSCWAFSSTGALEGAYQIATGGLVSLSEQELINGTVGMNMNSGCGGGWMFTAFTFVKTAGLATEESVPYTSYYAVYGSRLDLTGAEIGIPAGKVTGYSWIFQSATYLQSAIVSQPVSVAIEVSSMSFMLYKHGVLSQPECGTNVNHAVLAVGYSTKGKYWLIKNSWAATWGDKGYMKLKMDSNQAYDTCGITGYAFVPTLSAD